MSSPLRKFTDDLKTEIKLYKKKQMDLSTIISGYSIANEDLSDAYISELNVSELDISNCNLSRSSVKLILLNGVARNCNFSNTQFLEGSTLRGSDLRNSNFSNANAATVDYSFCDLRNASLCGVTFSMFSKKAYKAKFSKDLLELWKRFVDIEEL